MANIPSAAKRHRQSEKRRLRNKHYRSTVKTATRKVREALATKDTSKIHSAFREAESLIDRARSKGVFHPRAAARRISRLAQAVAKVAPQAPAAR